MKCGNRFLFFLLTMVLLAAAIACDDSGDDDDSEPADDDSVDDDVVDDDATDDDAADDDAADDDTADDDAADDDTTTYTGTKAPIVLMHGCGGFGYIGPIAYFAGVVDDLTEQGYEVFEPGVSPVNTMEERAAQWAEQIDEHFGAGTKINIIAHSQGGLDARYLVSTLGWGDRVGAVVMVSTPNRGTVLADIATGLIPGFAEDIIDWILNLLGMDWGGITELTQDYMTDTFNPANPDDPRVAYYSYQVDAADNCIWLLEPTHTIIGLFDGANDGIVDDARAVWGTLMGVESADHMSIIGQPVGFADFDHLGFYRGIAANLREGGF